MRQGKRTYLGSPDWMPRNFFRRIEVAFPVEQKEEEKKILESMNAFLEDNEFATELKSTGKYAPHPKERNYFRLRNILSKELSREIENQIKNCFTPKIIYALLGAGKYFPELFNSVANSLSSKNAVIESKIFCSSSFCSTGKCDLNTPKKKSF